MQWNQLILEWAKVIFSWPVLGTGLVLCLVRRYHLQVKGFLDNLIRVRVGPAEFESREQREVAELILEQETVAIEKGKSVADTAVKEISLTVPEVNYSKQLLNEIQELLLKNQKLSDSLLYWSVLSPNARLVLFWVQQFDGVPLYADYEDKWDPIFRDSTERSRIFRTLVVHKLILIKDGSSLIITDAGRRVIDYMMSLGAVPPRSDEFIKSMPKNYLSGLNPNTKTSTGN